MPVTNVDDENYMEAPFYRHYNGMFVKEQGFYLVKSKVDRNRITPGRGQWFINEPITPSHGFKKR